MEIISHRGYWKVAEEKNTEIAFRRSFSLGYGTETDIRDNNGELVISHDMPNGDELTFECFLKIYSEYEIDSTLALNIKSDGLQFKIKELLDKYRINNYFLFDMSIPDMFGYLKLGMNTSCRSSEYENANVFRIETKSVWYDGFSSLELMSERAKNIFNEFSLICIVSPELHNRKYKNEWEELKSLQVDNQSTQLILCTDVPEEATEYFYE
ncbi:TPA: hypothetical protein I7148_20550 [Vibrio vulnificus]|nr:hypothetical protein [Vibrio vulnificus]